MIFPLAEAASLTERMTLLVLEFAAILVVAKLAGELFERVLRQPAVLGELVAGIAIGPYALGGIDLPLLGHALFPAPGSGPLAPAAGATIPVSSELWALAQIAAIILLFVVGLETDFDMFLRYSFPGLLVGAGGVAGSFVLGDALTVAFGYAPNFMHPEALFMGAISVATSVGITARILSEKRALDSPEGTTILAGAVIDDVLGIIVLAIVAALAGRQAAAGAQATSPPAIDWAAVGHTAALAFGFWIVMTAFLAALSRPIARLIGAFPGHATGFGLALGLALLLAGIAETAGLAMIIGAYIVGLAISREPIARELIAGFATTSQLLVPVFFCVMGMTIDLRAIGGALLFGAVYTLTAVVGKVVGCGLPTYLVGFNTRGAIRVGLGMLPRGEVALIVAGAAISHDPPYVGPDVFGVAILMTVVTTLIAPPALVASFASPLSGLRRTRTAEGDVRRRRIIIEGLTPEGAALVRASIVEAFGRAGMKAHLVSAESEILEIVGEKTSVIVHAEKGSLVLDSTASARARVATIVEEGLRAARESISGARLSMVTLREGEPAAPSAIAPK